MMKRLLSLLLALALVLGCAAAFAEGETAAATTAEQTAEPAAPVLLATVNGKEITDQNSFFTNLVSYYQSMYSMYGIDMTDPEMLNYLKGIALEYAIDMEVIFAKAAEKGLDQFTDEEIKAFEKEASDYIEEYIASAMAQSGLADDASEEDKANARAAVLADMQAQGYNEETYLKDAVESSKTETIYNRIYNDVTGGITVSEEDVTAYFNDLVKEDMERAAQDPAAYLADYEEFKSYLDYPEYLAYAPATAYYIPEGYRAVTHILLTPDAELLETWKGLSAKLEEQNTPEETTTGTEEAAADATPEPTEEPVTQEMVDAAAKAIMDSLQPTIDEIQKKIADGANFADLIAEYGTDPGMQTEEGRAAGYEIHEQSTSYEANFHKAAMALEKAGDISEPVLGQFGVHIIQYLKDVPAGAVELSDALKAMLQETLLDESQKAAFEAAEKEWKAAAAIEYTEAGLVLKQAVEAVTAAEETTETPAEETANAPAEEAAEPTPAP